MTAQQPMSWRRVPGLLLRGVCMGLAEVVPGVSGGTIAFVTGIYAELVQSIARFGVSSLRLLGRPHEFVAEHNLGFLVSVAAGMGLGILLFARLMSELLAAVPVLVWAFFFGLIAASVFFIGRERRGSNLLKFGIPGFLAGLAMLLIGPSSAEPGLTAVFFGGMLAVCAWLLPAVSGAFLLLALGLYEHVINAVAEFEVVTLVTLGLGCASGLLLFAKALSWLLQRYYDPLLSTLTGFMLGSLVNLWPWRLPSHSGVDALAGPSDYMAATGLSPMVMTSIIAALFGILALWLLSRTPEP